MALGTTEAQLFAKQRGVIVSGALGGTGSSVAKAAMKFFFMYMGQFKNATQLLTYVISDLTVDINPGDAACKLWMVYLKKQATGTDAYFKVFDDTTDATAGNAKLAMPLLIASEEQFWFSPSGLDLATGLCIGSYTAFIGANNVTPSTTGDGPNGIMFYGKP